MGEARADQVVKYLQIYWAALLSVFDEHPELRETKLKEIEKELEKENINPNVRYFGYQKDGAPDFLQSMKDKNGNISEELVNANAGLTVTCDPTIADTLTNEFANNKIPFAVTQSVTNGACTIHCLTSKRDREQVREILDNINKNLVNTRQTTHNMALWAQSNRVERLLEIAGIEADLYDVMERKGMLRYIHGAKENPDGTKTIYVAESMRGRLEEEMIKANIEFSGKVREGYIAQAAEKNEEIAKYITSMLDSQKHTFIIDPEYPDQYVWSGKGIWHIVRGGVEIKTIDTAEPRQMRDAQQEIYQQLQGYSKLKPIICDTENSLEAKAVFEKEHAAIMRGLDKDREKTPDVEASLDEKLKYYKKNLREEILQIFTAKQIEEAERENGIALDNERILGNAEAEARSKGYDASVQEIREDRSANQAAIRNGVSVTSIDLSSTHVFGGGEDPVKEFIEELLQVGGIRQPATREEILDVLYGNEVVIQLANEPKEVKEYVIEDIRDTMYHLEDRTYEEREVTPEQVVQEEIDREQQPDIGEMEIS